MLFAGPVVMADECCDTESFRRRSRNWLTLTCISCLVGEPALGHRREGNAVCLREGDSAALVRRGRDHNAFVAPMLWAF